MVLRYTARLLRLLRLQPPLPLRQLIRRPPQDSHAPILRVPSPPPHYPQPAQSSPSHARQSGVTGIGYGGRRRRARIARGGGPMPRPPAPRPASQPGARDAPSGHLCRGRRQRRPLAKRVVEFAKTPSEQGALMLAAFGFRPWQPHSM
jgi:hypothetical protein